MSRCLAIYAAILLALSANITTASAQSANRGKHVFRKCLLCHVLDPKVSDQIAPPLHNVIGRRAAIVKGFTYSEIMKYAGSRGFKWTKEALFYFLDKPEDFMPGTYMAFAGLEEQERRDVIAYLEKLTRAYKRKQRRTKRRSRARQKRAQNSNPRNYAPIR